MSTTDSQKRKIRESIVSTADNWKTNIRER